jgi:hypothetical protein
VGVNVMWVWVWEWLWEWGVGRRRGGYSIPAGIVQESALDETSANWIPDEVLCLSCSVYLCVVVCLFVLSVSVLVSVCLCVGVCRLGA